LDARDLRAHLENEQSDMVIVSGRGRVIVTQIAGLIAGRIVTWVKAGDVIGKGDRYGLIRFGSQVDVLLPAGPESRTGWRQAYLFFALLLALTCTLFAAYLLRRDVQRDLRLAELRSQFVSSVTHELKTPLTAIRMFAGTLRLDEDVDHRTRDEYLDIMIHESERLSRLVDNILEFGKIEQ
jgi:signal transduction histidine kinase